MTRLSPILRSVDSSRGLGLIFWCPGCDGAHIVYVDGGPGPTWTYNGDPHKPTFTPSILVTYNGADRDQPDGCPSVCHSFVTDGQIQFCSDSSHALSGQTVPLPEWHQEYGGTED